MKSISSIFFALLITLIEGFIEPPQPPGDVKGNPPPLLESPHKSFPIESQNKVVHSSKSKFEEIVRSNTFVDKTLFIKLFLETRASMYITAPRGFGKSTNLFMLKTFLRLDINSNNLKIVNKNTTQSYRLFSKYRLAIFNETALFNQHFGEYPVLHFQFKKLALGNTSEHFLTSFRQVISETIEEHAYLLQSSALGKSEKELFERLRTRSEEDHPSSLVFCGKTLTSFLHTHFNRSCIILIDDFDSVLPQILTNEYTQNKVVVYVLSFLRCFLAYTMKNNTYLAKALLTGCVRLLPPEMPTDATEIQTISYSQNDSIASFYGFTESEVTKLAKKVGRSKDLEKVQKWYCCYTVDSSNLKLYNMYSISSYFRSGNLSSYWSDSGDIGKLRHIFDYHYLGNIIDESLSCNSISIALPYGMSHFNTENVIQLRNTIKHRILYDLREIHKNLFLKYIKDHGYYTVFRVSPAGYIYGRIPNREVEERLENYVYTTLYYIMKFDIPSKLIKLYVEAIENLNQNMISYKYFAKLVELIYDYLSGPVSEAEVLRILFTFANSSSKFHAVQKCAFMDREKKNYLVIVTESIKNSGHKGIIVDLNYGNNSAKEALLRIVDRKYYNVFATACKNCTVKTNIFIGLQLRRQPTECCACFLYNSTNIEDAKTVNVTIT